MTALLTIGEFAQATHLSVKALRHYDDIGLLRPADVDPSSGYRQYAAAQVPTAHVIRRFRDLDMPLEDIRIVLEAPDLETRDKAIGAHLERMQQTLAQTQDTVSSLRALLEGKEPQPPVEYRHIDATPAIAITEVVDWDDIEDWLSEALAELRRELGSTPARRGPDAALYRSDVFEAHVGEVTAFVPVRQRIPTSGRVKMTEIPAATVAVSVHHGPFSDLDQTYGALGSFVAERVLGAEGPIREYYIVTEADDPADLRTEVCWPIRDTGSPSRSPS